MDHPPLSSTGLACCMPTWTSPPSLHMNTVESLEGASYASAGDERREMRADRLTAVAAMANGCSKLLPAAWDRAWEVMAVIVVAPPPDSSRMKVEEGEMDLGDTVSGLEEATGRANDGRQPRQKLWARR